MPQADTMRRGSFPGEQCGSQERDQSLSRGRDDGCVRLRIARRMNTNGSYEGVVLIDQLITWRGTSQTHRHVVPAKLEALDSLEGCSDSAFMSSTRGASVTLRLCHELLRCASVRKLL